MKKPGKLKQTYQNLADLIMAGTNLPDALRRLNMISTRGRDNKLDRMESGAIREVLVETGFPERDAWLIQLGQEEGQLERIFRQLAEVYGQLQEMEYQLRGPLMYFLCVLFVASVILVGFVGFFQSWFLGFLYGGGLFGGTFVIGYMIRRDFRRRLVGRSGSIVAGILTSLPFFYGLDRELRLALFYSHWFLLHGAGVQLSRAFRVLGRSSYGIKGLESASAQFEQGHPPDRLPTSFSSQFPESDWQKIIVGQESGQLTESLEELARTKMRSVRGKMEALPRILSVIFVLIAGAVVAFVIYQVYSNVYGPALRELGYW